MSALALAARPYLSVLRARFFLMLQYRTAAWAGVATQFWFGAIRVMTLVAFYAGGGKAPLSLAQVVTYIWLGQAFLAMLPWAADTEIAAGVESGNVGYERLRPVDTYFLWFARALAWRIANTSLRAGPVFVLAAVLLPLTGMADWAWRLPASANAALLFALSIALTALLSSAMTVLLNVIVVAMKTTRVVGFSMGFVNLFSGLVLPLALFPDWAQDALLWQPFAGLADIPYRIYFGALSGTRALEGLVAQALWIVLLALVGRWWLSRVLARIDMQGS
jgi:ABC-2 type transport system permease protein